MLNHVSLVCSADLNSKAAKGIFFTYFTNALAACRVAPTSGASCTSCV